MSNTEKSIAFVRGADIYVMDADGKNARNLTNHPAVDTQPHWHRPVVWSVAPSGKSLKMWGWLKR